MSLTLSQEFRISLVRALRTVVPRPEARIDVTWANAPYMLQAIVPFTFMAYLVRRPDTRLLRILLLPLVITTTLHSAFAYAWRDPRLNVYNWGGALAAFVVIAKSIDMAFATKGRMKQGEKELGTMQEPAIAAKQGSQATGDQETRHRPFANVLPTWLEDAFEIMFALRGIGWDFGRDVPVPPPTRPQQRGPFLWATFLSFLSNYLLVDLIESVLKLVPGVGSVEGGTIFLPWLPPFQRYALSTAIHFSTGCALLAGFGMVYDLCTFLAVLLLGHSPTAWPPVMDNPWIAQSLHEFWSKRWHQLLRQTFLVFGGIPGRWIGGNLGLVLGTFLASGLFHECSIYVMGHGWDSRVPLFFLLQGGAVIGERIWRRVTHRRVDGYLGMLWVYFDIVILGQPLVDAWHRRGLAGGMIIPPPISPARLWIIPAVRKILGV